MRSIARSVILLWGWRRLGVAALAGALSALAQAPFHLAPVLFVTLPVLVWLIDGSVADGPRGLRRLRPAAAVGWWFGFGYFLAGLWWIGAAFLVEAETFGWLMPFAVVALPAGLALFTAAGCAVARAIWPESATRIFALALGLSGSEWLRGHLLTGFPWNLIGQAVGFTDVTAQAAAVVGVYGLTAAGIVVFAAPAVLADAATGRRWAKPLTLAVAVLLLAADVGYGVWRLASAPDLASGGDGTRIRIVQPAIDQSQKWDPEMRERTLQTYLEMSDLRNDSETLGALSFGLIVWPETALPFFLTEEPEALARIGTMLPPGTTLVTGAPRVEPDGEGRRFYNSVYVIDDTGQIRGAYDKAHLVPFGEYVPLAPVLERLGLRQLAHSVGGFSAGRGPASISLPDGLRSGMLVCYEIIFPGAATDPADRPDVILNVTNDAWYGRTPGPYQHLDLARMRAVEEGLPVIRAANSGISAVIDPYGRYVAKLGLGEVGVLDSQIPARNVIPPFSKVAPYFLLTFYVFSFILVLAGARYRIP